MNVDRIFDQIRPAADALGVLRSTCIINALHSLDYVRSRRGVTGPYTRKELKRAKNIGRKSMEVVLLAQGLSTGEAALPVLPLNLRWRRHRCSTCGKLT